MIIVERTLDIGICINIMHYPEMWELIAEDGADKMGFIPDVVNEFWLSIYEDNELIGVARFEQVASRVLKGHINILPRHRKNSKEAGEKILNWVENNTDCLKIITQVPVIFQNVINYLESFSFKKEGEIANFWLKNGELSPVAILTKELTEWE